MELAVAGWDDVLTLDCLSRLTGQIYGKVRISVSARHDGFTQKDIRGSSHFLIHVMLWALLGPENIGQYEPLT